jgi:hypothetical protein
MTNVYFGLFLAIIALAGCSSETVKRTTYESLQNVRQQECLKNRQPDCEKREYYDDYERKRKELDSPN